MSACSVAAAALLCASPAMRDVAGIAVPESIKVAGQRLHLNGAGARRIAIFDVYVVALYLVEPETNPDEVVASEQLKAVHLISRLNISRQKVMGEFEWGLRNNSPEEVLPKLLQQLELVRAIVPDLKRGQLLSFLYRPGKGITVSVKGGRSVLVPGKDFADALLRSVLGKNPLDEKLKENLLRGW